MSEGHLNASSQISDVMLILCDPAGKILAVSTSAPKEIVPCSPAAHQHYSEIFGEGAAITDWLTHHIGQARRQSDYFAETVLENGDRRLRVRLESLTCEQDLYGYALTLAPAKATAASHALEEGDTVIYRKQWHEIKNHIGALKLYATFLNK